MVPFTTSPIFYFIKKLIPIYQVLTQTIAFTQDGVSLFSKAILTKRLTTFYGDNTIKYRYSNVLKSITMNKRAA